MSISSARLRTIVQSNDPDRDSMPGSSQNSGPPSSNDGTNEDLDDDEVETEPSFTPAREPSKLQITYEENSAIKEIKFFDSHDKQGGCWKAVFPIEKNQCSRIAASIAVLMEVVLDNSGNLLSPELASEILEMLLGDMEKQRALSSMNVLYSTYSEEDKARGYLREGRIRLKDWFDRNSTELDRHFKVVKTVSFSAQNRPPKRRYGGDYEEAARPAKRSPRITQSALEVGRESHAVALKPIEDVIQVQPSPPSCHTIPYSATAFTGQTLPSLPPAATKTSIAQARARIPSVPVPLFEDTDDIFTAFG